MSKKTVTPDKLLDTLIIDTVGSLVIVADRNGKIVRFNHAATHILEYQPEEVLEKKVCDLFPFPDDRGRCLSNFDKLVNGQHVEAQVAWRSKSGAKKHIAFICRSTLGSDGRVKYIVGTGIDVTDRVLTEQAIRENEHRFRTTFEGAAIGIALCDEKGRYTRVNPAFCKLTGYGSEELLQMDLAAITHPEDRGENLKLFHELAGGKREAYVFQKRYINKAGELVWVKVSASLANVGLGQPVTIIGLFENISARIKAEQTLANEYQEIERQVKQRTAELAESEKSFRELADSHLRLAREVEHRVRNNLSGLMGLIGAMRYRTTDVKAFADAIESRIGAMAQVHHRLAGSKWTALGMVELIDGAFDALGHLAPNAAPIEVAGPDIAVGPRQALPLTLVLVELFMNSCKYGPHSLPGGSVHIDWEVLAKPQGRTIRINWKEQDGPRITRPVVPSLGTDLVKGFVGRELGGTCELRYPPEGADHTIEFLVRGE
jgi:PAS domain S-box-containing protein